MTKRELFRTTIMEAGTVYDVLASSSIAIMISIKRVGRVAYQVIDYTDSYPSKSSQVDELNPFRTVDIHLAEEEYKKRNQSKIK